MPKLFKIAGLQRLEAGAGTVKKATPHFLRPSGPGIVRPTVSPRIAPVPVQMPNKVNMPNHVGPWETLAKGTISFIQAYENEAIKIQDEKDRVDASEAARAFDDEVRRLTRGDHEDEVGYLYLMPKEAMDRKREYEQRMDAAFNRIAEGLSPNARRYASEKMLGYRRVGLREIGDHALKSHRARQQDEQKAQYASFLRRLDDHGADVGSAMAEIASYTLTRTDEEQEAVLSGILTDYTNLLASKDPEIALPLMIELQEKAGPAWDVNSQTNYNRRMAEVSRRYNAEQVEKDGFESRKMANIRRDNRLQFFTDMRSEEGPNLAHYEREVMAGRMEIGHFNTMRKQWENRDFLPKMDAQTEFNLKQQYLQGKINEDSLLDLDIRQTDKDNLFDFMAEIEADERKSEIRHYYDYIAKMIKSRPEVSTFRRQTADVSARNAQEAFRRMIKDPTNKRTINESATHILEQYGVNLKEYDKIPMINIPGKPAIRPKDRTELIKSVQDAKAADELGLLTPAERTSLFHTLKAYDGSISEIEEREKEQAEKEAKEKAERERGLIEKVKGWFGGEEEVAEETE